MFGFSFRPRGLKKILKQVSIHPRPDTYRGSRAQTKISDSDIFICVFIVPSSNLFSKQMMCHARSAWWLETELYARIVPPPPRFTRQPQKEKMFLAFRICARPIFSKNRKDFFFLGFCPPSIQAVWRGFNSDSAKRKNYFLGKRIFRFASANLFLDFVRAEERSGEESARASFLIFATETTFEKIIFYSRQYQRFSLEHLRFLLLLQ